CAGSPARMPPNGHRIPASVSAIERNPAQSETGRGCPQSDRPRSPPPRWARYGRPPLLHRSLSRSARPSSPTRSCRGLPPLHTAFLWRRSGCRTLHPPHSPGATETADRPAPLRSDRPAPSTLASPRPLSPPYSASTLHASTRRRTPAHTVAHPETRRPPLPAHLEGSCCSAPKETRWPPSSHFRSCRSSRCCPYCRSYTVRQLWRLPVIQDTSQPCCWCPPVPRAPHKGRRSVRTSVREDPLARLPQPSAPSDRNRL